MGLRDLSITFPRDIPRGRSILYMPRVLSLLSASTEIVCRLGCSHMLVGRSHGCDDPMLATVLPIATAPRVDPNAPSKELDASVRAQAVGGGPVYHVHNELVRKLSPDVIITQEQCRICAVTPEDVNVACRGLPAMQLVTIKPTTLDDVLGDIMTIATALGVPERGNRLVEMIRNRLAQLLHLTAHVSPKPRVAHVEWLSPLMGSGYWIAELCEAANATMVCGSRGGHSQTLESMRALADADVILLAPCGFGLERTHAELKMLGLLEAEEWLQLPAVKRGAVAVADGNLYFNRSSCGVLDTAEIVAEVVHDSICGLFGHHGNNWVRLSELESFCSREGAASVTKHVELAPPHAMAAPPPAAKRAQLDASQVERIDSPEEWVRAQVERLRAAEFAAAFAMNSVQNRARLGNADQFAAVVRGNPSFAALADPANKFECHVEPDGQTEGRHSIIVRVHGAGHGDLAHDLSFSFDVSSVADGAGARFATDGVRILC